MTIIPLSHSVLPAMYRRRYLETECTRLISDAAGIVAPELVASLGSDEVPVLLLKSGDKVEMLMTTHRTFLICAEHWKVIDHVDVTGVDSRHPVEKARQASKDEFLKLRATMSANQMLSLQTSEGAIDDDAVYAHYVSSMESLSSFEPTVTLLSGLAKYTFSTERGSPHYGILRLYRFIVSSNSAILRG